MDLFIDRVNNAYCTRERNKQIVLCAVLCNFCYIKKNVYSFGFIIYNHS